MKYNLTISWILAGLFFALQIAGITAGRFTESKFFCWAPYDEISLYSIGVSVNGNELTRGEIYSRYRIAPNGRENRSIHNIISIVRQFENTYGKNEGAFVKVTYLTNGYRKEVWTWPENDIQYAK